MLNVPGTIDSDYRGEIKVPLINLGAEAFVITPNMRIAQLVIAPYTQATFVHTDTIDEYVSERGDGGFGSTGV